MKRVAVLIFLAQGLFSQEKFDLNPIKLEYANSATRNESGASILKHSFALLFENAQRSVLATVTIETTEDLEQNPEKKWGDTIYSTVQLTLPSQSRVFRLLREGRHFKRFSTRHSPSPAVWPTILGWGGAYQGDLTGGSLQFSGQLSFAEDYLLWDGEVITIGRPDLERNQNHDYVFTLKTGPRLTTLINALSPQDREAVKKLYETIFTNDFGVRGTEDRYRRYQFFNFNLPLPDIRGY